MNTAARSTLACFILAAAAIAATSKPRPRLTVRRLLVSGEAYEVIFYRGGKEEKHRVSVTTD